LEIDMLGMTRQHAIVEPFHCGLIA
jgi:hypothetical protein